MTNKIKILLVDDEPDVIEILTYNLSNQGYEVFSANDGIKACLLYTSPSQRDRTRSRMPSSA